jgi:hypothetical protein
VGQRDYAEQINKLQDDLKNPDIKPQVREKKQKQLAQVQDANQKFLSGIPMIVRAYTGQEWAEPERQELPFAEKEKIKADEAIRIAEAKDKLKPKELPKSDKITIFRIDPKSKRAITRKIRSDQLGDYMTRVDKNGNQIWDEGDPGPAPKGKEPKTPWEIDARLKQLHDGRQ